jgi:eukaryotic-like serine/threonine-protein kinase
MVKPNDGTINGPDVAPDESDEDDRVGEAVELYMLSCEQGPPPDLDEFVARFPGLEDDLRAAIDGLELVHGLLGLGSATGSGTGRRGGLDHRIESGQRIAGYRVVRELGRGGMGTVYEAVHVGLDRPVALKVLGVHAAPDSSARRRFLNEARTAAGLHHTHIVPVFDVGQVGGLCYYAMQRIEGSGLDRVLKHLRRTRQVASGGGEALSSSRLPSFLSGGGLGAAQANASRSRVIRFWARLPASLLRGRKGLRRPLEQAEAPLRSSLPGIAPEPAPNNGVPSRSFSHADGSTASWGTASREGRQAAADAPAGGLQAIAQGSLASLTSPDPDRRRRELEPPPFDPPRGPAYFRWVAKVGLESADALAHAHEQGVIHRDVKPSNLLIDAKGSIWVTDFGLARRLADPGITHHDSLLGTPRYMSPEQARTGTIDGRTDVYSLGATLYELVSLRPPFDGQTAAELIDQIGGQDPLPPTMIDRRVPRDLETVVLKALAKRPADRYASAAELFEDLDRFLNREPVKARRIGPIGRAWRVARRHPGITVVSTAAAALVLAIATLAYLKVVSERNLAVAAQLKSVELWNREKAANATQRAARKETLGSTIQLAALSGAPTRRSNGLKLVKEAAELEPNNEERTQLRDSAVKFLVLREIEPSNPALATGRARGLIFTPTGHQLAILSEDDDELDFWDVQKRRQLTKLPLRGGAATVPMPVTERTSDSAGGRPETAAGAGSAALPGMGGQRSGQGGRGRPFPFQRLAQVGPYIAIAFPGERGLGLLDLLSGSPLRSLNLPDHYIVGLVGEPTGHRLITIEQVQDDVIFHVNLWDADHLERPIATLPWRTDGSRGFSFPLVAISPDARTVAVAAQRGAVVRLYSALDGNPLARGEIEPQAELSAIALGPNNMLATAGNTSGGTSFRVWDLDSHSFPIGLTPGQSNTRLMRFNPQGNLLAIMGSGPIELWDPVALNLVAALLMSDQPTDIAFAPDGMTLSAVGRSGEAMVWTVHDSAARTQLSGFDTPPSSLAFGNDGLLAATSGSGEFWTWRSGRCPEIGAAVPNPAMEASSPAIGPQEPRHNGGIDSNRRGGGRMRGEGPPPGGRGLMGVPPTIGFDSCGRLVLHDYQGLRVFAEAAGSVLGPAKFRVPGAATQGSGGRGAAVARTPDGEMMAVVRGSSISLWRAEAPDTIIPVELPPQFASKAALPPPGNGSRRREPGGGNDPRGPAIRSIQISPHGDRIYSVEQRGPASVLRAWAIDLVDGASSARARELRSATLDQPFTRIVLRPDGKFLAAINGMGQVTLLDASSLAVIAGLAEPGKPAESFLTPALAFSPDGRSLAVGSSQGTISLWSLDVTTRPQLRLHLPGHRGLVTSLVYDPHGRRLASATWRDAIVEVWDLAVIETELVRLKLAD